MMVAQQTIAQVKQQHFESLWAFLSQLPHTFEAQEMLALGFGALIGMTGHYIKGRATGSIGGNFMDYFFRDNVWRSIASAASILVELVTEMSAGLFITDSGEFIGWGLVILSGIKTGYGLDSIVNKSSRAEWTDAQRASNQQKKEPSS